MNHLKSNVGTGRCVSVDQAQHFPEDWKRNVLEYKIDLEEKGASKAMPMARMNFANADSKVSRTIILQFDTNNWRL